MICYCYYHKKKGNFIYIIIYWYPNYFKKFIHKMNKIITYKFSWIKKIIFKKLLIWFECSNIDTGIDSSHSKKIKKNLKLQIQSKYLRSTHCRCQVGICLIDAVVQHFTLRLNEPRHHPHQTKHYQKGKEKTYSKTKKVAQAVIPVNQHRHSCNTKKTAQ